MVIISGGKLTATDIKTHSMAHFLFGGYHSVVTEYKGADLYGITKRKYSHEWEIKVNRSDLMKELVAINNIQKGTGQIQYKGWKHEKIVHYTGASEYYYDVPNKFSFIVTSDLVAVAQEYLVNTLYGIYDAGAYGTPRIIQRARHIHKNPISEAEFMYLIRKTSVEIYTTRQALFNKQSVLK